MELPAESLETFVGGKFFWYQSIYDVFVWGETVDVVFSNDGRHVVLSFRMLGRELPKVSSLKIRQSLKPSVSSRVYSNTVYKYRDGYILHIVLDTLGEEIAFVDKDLSQKIPPDIKVVRQQFIDSIFKQ